MRSFLADASTMPRISPVAIAINAHLRCVGERARKSAWWYSSCSKTMAIAVLCTACHGRFAETRLPQATSAETAVSFEVRLSSKVARLRRKRGRRSSRELKTKLKIMSRCMVPVLSDERPFWCLPEFASLWI